MVQQVAAEMLNRDKGRAISTYCKRQYLLAGGINLETSVSVTHV